MAKAKQKKEETTAISKALFMTIDLKDIVLSDSNPRKYINEHALQELSESIKQIGVLQPIVVHKSKDEIKYELICGERRYRAATLAGNTEIPCFIHNKLPANTVLEMQIIENLQRKDVHAMEEAQAIKSMQNSGYKLEDIAHKLAKPLQYITQRIKLNNLTEDWQKLFFENRIRYTDAFKVARLMQEEQQELFGSKNTDFDDEDENDGKIISFNNYEFNRFKCELDDAEFDITDKKLVPGVGACTNCQFNTAFATLLFPDETDGAICTNRKCFDNKTTASLKHQVDRIIKENVTVCIDTYYLNNSEKAIVEQLVSAGITVIGHNDYYKVSEPSELMNYEEWLKDEYPIDNVFEDDEEQEAKEDYENYKESWQEDQVSYDADLKTAIEVELLFGGRTGEKVFINIKPTKGNKVVESENGEQLPGSQILVNIVNLKEKRDRIKELNSEKLYTHLKELSIGKNLEFKKPNKTLVAYYWLMKSEYRTRKKFCNKHGISHLQPKANLLEVIAKHATEDDILLWQNEALVKEFQSATITTSSGDGAALKAILEPILKDEIETFKLQLEEKSIKQIQKIESQITELESQLTK